jgi:hypothetical protein
MKVAIITSVGQESSKILCQALINNKVDAQVFDMKKTDKRDFREFDWVFNYGSSVFTKQQRRLNSDKAVKTCIDKPSTFNELEWANCYTVDHVLNKPIPAHWEWVVIRDKKDGRKAEGLNYHENNENVPDGQLYSEYFEHKYEYRIVVFRGEVVGRYFKCEDKGDWYFNIQPKKGFEIMDDHCIRAAKALGIDYVGFDVVAVNKKDFRILEANSCPRITDEAENAIVSFFINL